MILVFYGSETVQAYLKLYRPRERMWNENESPEGISHLIYNRLKLASPAVAPNNYRGPRILPGR